MRPHDAVQGVGVAGLVAPFVVVFGVWTFMLLAGFVVLTFGVWLERRHIDTP